MVGVGRCADVAAGIFHFFPLLRASEQQQQLQQAAQKPIGETKISQAARIEYAWLDDYGSTTIPQSRRMSSDPRLGQRHAQGDADSPSVTITRGRPKHADEFLGPRG